MSRVARAVVAAQPHHVTQRGNRRAAVFHADEERRDYLRWMREYAALHGVAVWAYCLMTNHAHWLLVPRRADALARALRGAHTVYALQYNTRHQTSGHLWQGRFHSCPLDDAHLWAAVRYIERNPVRAGMVAKACDYPWSSAPAHCGLRKDPLLDPAFPPSGVVEDWAEWLTEPDDEECMQRIRSSTRTGRPCGSDDFTSSIERALQRTLQPQPRGRKPKADAIGQQELFP